MRVGGVKTEVMGVYKEVYRKHGEPHPYVRDRFGFATGDIDYLGIGLFLFKPQKARFLEYPVGLPTLVSPQKSSGNKAKESKECQIHRARLIQDKQNRAILEDAWKRSQPESATPVEQGGLLGEVIDYGESYQKDRRADAQFSRPPGTHPTTLGPSFVPWALRRIGEDSQVNNYNYWYHTHPFNEGDVVEGVTVGNPNIPSTGDSDVRVSERLGLNGVLISKEYIVVFDRSGTKCLFRR